MNSQEDIEFLLLSPVSSVSYYNINRIIVSEPSTDDTIIIGAYPMPMISEWSR